MPLKTGTYFIQNRRNFLGHSEDKPPAPQRVITLPGGVLAPKWFVEQVGEDLYTIKTDEGRTRTIEDKIFAITVYPGPEPEVWYITPNERGGKDSYVYMSCPSAYITRN
ncbi:serine protease inhibitor [Moniliophthora roreri]|nr:serine protease inhibitor [Moniliophthora roreri]